MDEQSPELIPEDAASFSGRGWLARSAAYIGAGLLLWMVLLATPEFGCVVHSAPNGTQVVVERHPKSRDLSPSVIWSATDSARVFVGFDYDNMSPTIGWVIDPLRQRPVAQAVHGDGRDTGLRSDWLSSATAPRYRFVGVSLPSPRLAGGVGFFPIPDRIEWEPHGWGLESVVFNTSSGPRVLLLRWVWNSRAPEVTDGGLKEPRGQFVGFLKRTRGGWGVWI